MKMKFRVIDAACRDFPAIRETFEKLIQPMHGPQDSMIRKIGEGADRLCEGLYVDDVLKALVVYKKRPSEHSKGLDVKTFTLLSPQVDAGKGYEAVLLSKLKDVAKQRAAEHIFLTLPVCREADISLLEREGFSVKSEMDNPHKPAEKLRVLGYKIPAVAPPALMGSPAALGAGAPVADRGHPERKRRADDAAPGEEAKKRSSGETDHVEKQAARESEKASSHYPVGGAAAPRSSLGGGGGGGGYVSRAQDARFFPGAGRGAPQNQREPKFYSCTLKAQYVRGIQRGDKQFEGRVNVPMFQNYRAGDTVKWFGGGESVTTKIVERKDYKSFRAMLEDNDYKKMVPEARSLEHAVSLYNAIPGYPEKSARLGVVAFKLETVAPKPSPARDWTPRGGY